MKKVLKLVMIYGFVITIIASISIAGTLAYLSDKKDTTNVLTFGNVVIKLSDANDTNGGNHIAPLNSRKRTPVVTNIGTVPGYIRAEVKISGNLPGNQQNIGDFVEITKNTTDWNWSDYDTTGFVYYKNVLDTGKETEPIFTSIKLNSTDASANPFLEGANETLKVIIDVQAVQSEIEGQTFTDSKTAFETIVSMM